MDGVAGVQRRKREGMVVVEVVQRGDKLLVRYNLSAEGFRKGEEGGSSVQVRRGKMQSQLIIEEATHSADEW